MFGSEGAMRQSSSRLNESPSEKEGKFYSEAIRRFVQARLNESPSEKEGKLLFQLLQLQRGFGLNESPSEKEGKYPRGALQAIYPGASMKVPPKRKGNRLFLDRKLFYGGPQ